MRNLLIYIICIGFVVINFGCTKQYIELAYPKPIDSAKIGKIKTVVILGNSIVKYGPDPSLNWTGNWGLAASKIDSDFVHILIRNIKLKDNSVNIKYANIAGFELDFSGFIFSSIDSLKDADLIVMKIAENVQANGPNYNQFINYYDQLVQYLDPSKKAVKLIVDGFWEREPVNTDIRNYAVSKKYPLISITDLSAPKNKGLAGHPNDQGMRLIAERLWKYISNYF